MWSSPAEPSMVNPSTFSPNSAPCPTKNCAAKPSANSGSTSVSSGWIVAQW
jgi:hypothetical protein